MEQHVSSRQPRCNDQGKNLIQLSIVLVVAIVHQLLALGYCPLHEIIQNEFACNSLNKSSTIMSWKCCYSITTWWQSVSDRPQRLFGHGFIMDHGFFSWNVNKGNQVWLGFGIFYQSLCKYCSYFITNFASTPQLTGTHIFHEWICPKLGTVPQAQCRTL